MNYLPGGSLEKFSVVASASVIFFLTFGTTRLSSQLFVAAIERFNTGRKEASFPFILCNTVGNLSGPIVGWLGDKYGLKSVTLAGCLLSAVAVGGCYFAEDITTFTVLWGGFFGIGFGMGILILPNILHLHFDNNFNRMFGISLSCGCIGSLVLPVITDNLLKNYGTSGALLILSGIMLHCVPAAMLISVPKKPRKYQSRKADKQINESELQNLKIEDTEHCRNSLILNRRYHAKTTENTMSQSQSISSLMYDSELDRGSEINTCLGTKRFELILRTSTDSLPNPTAIQVKGNVDHVKTVESHIPTEIDSNVTQNHIEVKSILSEAQVVRYSPTSTESSTTAENVLTRDSETKNKKSEVFQSKILKRQKHVKEKDVSKLPFLSALQKLAIFLDPAYILILVSLGLSLVVIVTIQTIIVDACRDKGIMEDVTVLLIYALTELVGRLLFGYLADIECISLLYLFALCYGSCGILIIGFMWLSGFYTVLIVVAGYGAMMGGMFVLPFGLMANNIPKENLTMAFSSRYFLYALLSFSQSPIIGYFRETLRSYDGLLYLLGGICFLGTIITLFIPPAARWRDNRRNC